MIAVKAAGMRGVVAYSPLTDEHYSANADDYAWRLPPEHCLTDAAGEDMILVTEQVVISDVELPS